MLVQCEPDAINSLPIYLSNFLTNFCLFLMSRCSINFRVKSPVSTRFLSPGAPCDNKFGKTVFSKYELCSVIVSRELFKESRLLKT